MTACLQIIYKLSVINEFLHIIFGSKNENSLSLGSVKQNLIYLQISTEKTLWYKLFETNDIFLICETASERNFVWFLLQIL